ncbi:MAG TPA: DUF2024 family protein [Saprospiraceae bacterium]|nr:DUF2024 family protein [Saprospiraceae bacterium]HRO07544.1 DUF2024 family protein [Saprospiraceae bacterium]HRO72330.1 DUF2024 family protein [Saprospiraceae bacterium]HRP40827.1 DUF2024 family protein [Saprospiraceae bacterium]
MKVAVWDTYVTRNDGVVMHFDIIVPDAVKDAETVYTYGRTYLKNKNLKDISLTSKECTFCHVESIRSSWKEAIETHGYYIYEMENCE